MNSKYLIVGAGLSGLVTAYNLRKSGEDDFVILEAKKTSGGRIVSENGMDLGPTWFQFFHENLIELLEELGLNSFDQYSNGKNMLVFSETDPVHYFESDTREPSAKRITGGSINLIEKLTELVQDKIEYDVKVKSISDEGETLVVNTNKNSFEADKVVLTLPPKLAVELTYLPELKAPVVNFMKGVHTWMSNSMKVALTYKAPFWREKGLSGTILGQLSPMVELYDHSSSDDSIIGLMGFVNESMKGLSFQERQQKIVDHIAKQLGEEARDFLTYSEKDWSQDEFTSTKDIEAPYGHPRYGHPIFREFHLNGKLLFSGTETSKIYGGYME